jgi:hypothetical protein
MPKVIRVTMPDGSRWDVPADVVATHRAHEFAKDEGYQPGTPDYDGEFQIAHEYALAEHDELLDWAANNMNWADVEGVAVLVEAAPEVVDYQEGWINGEKEVVGV